MNLHQRDERKHYYHGTTDNDQFTISHIVN